MANFLIYNKTHWMDLPSKDMPSITGYERNLVVIASSNIPDADRIKRTEILNRKHEAISTLGDIVEVRPDKLTMTEKEKEAFRLIKVPDLDYEIAKQYHAKLMDGIIIKKKFKYSINISEIPFDSNGEITLTKKQVLALLTEKT